MTPAVQKSTFSLQERYEAKEGTVLMTGIQALVRALQTRAQLDQAAGLDSGGFVSGYRGSPLGGLDKELWQEQTRLKEHNIHFQPGVNEDLAATAVWGTQQVGLHGGNTVEGVFGMWYGKAPGLDRSCDAIRHANAWGTSNKGGVLLVVGDDPAAKSSSLATQSEFALQDMMVPILAPANVQEVLDFAVLGWSMSRHSGLWVSLKAIADHMDSSATLDVAMQRYTEFAETLPVADEDVDIFIRREDTPHAQEARLLADKLPRAIEFARAAGLNRWVTRDGTSANPSDHRAKLGIVCAGKAYSDVREALASLGLDTEESIRAAGIELLKLGLTWPLDQSLVRDFAARTQQLLVVEEKRAFVESQLKEALYGESAVPVEGKFDRDGRALIPQTGILEVSDLAEILRCKLAGERFSAEVSTSAEAKKARTPLFCAGCPHNTSTRVPEGSRATAGIGCHYMVQWMNRDTDSCTHMGGEGVTWVGESLFTEEDHIFANLGDGTYFHSGILAIRQAVAAGINITYKVLFNDAVAMTGGQPTDGELTVRDLVRQVEAEGVNKVVIVSDTPEMHAAESVDVYHRRDLDQVQKSLREVAGTSILIYQQTCATELRRRRKRGLVEDVKPRLYINPEVCEGCGDCTVKSSCVAVEPLQTPFGTKRQINQTACNKDLSCSDGFCPAFVEVEGEPVKTRATNGALSLADVIATLPLPERGDVNRDILITGVGGTGIVTVSALLAAAAKVDGLNAKTLDMTGLAQKGGAVFSHVRLGSRSTNAVHTPRIPNRSADTLVACDLVTAASDEALALLGADAVASVNSHVIPTADFVLGGTVQTNHRKQLQKLKGKTARLSSVDADGYVMRALGNTMQANIFLLGHAYQQGGIPLSIESVETAIEVNAQAVAQNILAFHLGRLAAFDKARLAELLPSAGEPRARHDARDVDMMSLDELIAHRAKHLTVYQGANLARKFADLVERVREAEHRIRPGAEQLTRAVAQSYAKVLSPKDEYEVARLHADPQFKAKLGQEFGTHSVRFLLAPPALGTRKRRFGSWMKYGFALLARAKRLRNTWLDPFAYSHDRKLDLQLISNFETVVEELLQSLSVQNHAIAVALAKLPLSVRGFGYVKARAWEKAQVEQAELMNAFREPPTPVHVFDPHAKKEAA